MVSLSTQDYGIYTDIEAFYASDQTLNKLGFTGRLFFGLAKRQANKKIDALRKSMGSDKASNK